MNDAAEPAEAAEPAGPAGPARVECPPTKEPAVRWFIFAAMMIAVAIWCYSDRRERPEVWDFKHFNDAASYVLNNWGPVLFAPLGLIAAAMGVRYLRRKLIADEEGIGYAGKDKVAWGQVEELDASLLGEKGILTLRFGQGRSLKLDSWKLQNFRELVSLMEKKVPEDKQRR